MKRIIIACLLGMFCLTLLLLVMGQTTGASPVQEVRYARQPSGATATLTPTPTITPTGTATFTDRCQIVIHDSIVATDPVQTGILNFEGTPSDCQEPPRSCPGVADTLPRHYKAYRYYNPFGSFSWQCINVRIDATGCAGNLFSAAYLASYNGNDLCTNLRGDVGSPIVNSGSYNFIIYRGTYLVVVVDEVAPGSGCSDYTVTITPEYDCLAGPTPTITSTPTYVTNTPTPTRTSTAATSTATPTFIATSTASATATNTPLSTPIGTATFTDWCPIIVHDSITASDPEQAGILNFEQVPSVCQEPPRPCPGVADTTPRHYKVYRYFNPGGSFSWQCVNIRVDTSSCSGNLFSTAYLTSFNPDDLCTNYLGDVGSPIVSSGSYNIDIHRGYYLVVVVEEITPGSGCSDFTLTITPQYECLGVVIPTVTPTNTHVANTPTPTRTSTRFVTSTPTSYPATVTSTSMPIVTSTPIPTRTGTPTVSASNTPSLTPTVCPVTFSDVPPGSTFYAYVHCLACLGIVQGYDDGTFRPNNSVTRGQAAKIISNSAGYSDPIPTGQQTFVDVPPGSTFWLYVERAALHGAINGYPCGGVGEPCPGTYFRPQNTLTRGQAAKITAIAAGYNDQIPPGRQTFSDVQLGSTFWLYVERIALHGVVSGYSDGTFRPQNSVTRGQLAKMASLAFFPGCEK